MVSISHEGQLSVETVTIVLYRIISFVKEFIVKYHKGNKRIILQRKYRKATQIVV